MHQNNYKPSLDYLHEMGIDIWIPRSKALSGPLQTLSKAIATACQIPVDQLLLSQTALEALLRHPLGKKHLWQSLKDERLLL